MAERFAELLARAATMGTRWDLPDDHKQTEQDLFAAGRALDEDNTILGLRVHDLEMENARLKEGRKSGGRAPDGATEAYAVLGAFLLHQGLEEAALRAAVTGAVRTTGSTRAIRVADRVVQAAVQRRKRLEP